jgi:hypothetical protein
LIVRNANLPDGQSGMDIAIAVGRGRRRRRAVSPPLFVDQLFPRFEAAAGQRLRILLEAIALWDEVLPTPTKEALVAALRQGVLFRS